MWKVVLMLFSLIVVVYPCMPCYDCTGLLCTEWPDYCSNIHHPWIYGNEGQVIMISNKKLKVLLKPLCIQETYFKFAMFIFRD